MSLRILTIDTLLGVTVAACWLGAAGMLRMRHPVQALQYLSVPATVGAFAATVAVFTQEGFCSASLKTFLTVLVLLMTNAVATHAIARAFRTRELGHWKPRDGDAVEFVNGPPAERES